MPRSCTVCTHDEGHAINVALVQRVPYRDIARQYGVSKDALSRHLRDHVPQQLVKASEALEAADADDLLEQVRGLQARTLNILEAAETSREHRTALAAIRETRSNLELLAKLLGELDERPQVNILASSEWLELRTVIVGALEPYSEARGAVLQAIKDPAMVELKEDLRLALDRVSFAERLGIDPDPWQRDLLRSDSGRVLLLCSRQAGKSTMSAVIALHRALYHPGSLILCLAPALRQSQELFGKVTGFYRELGRPVVPQAERRLSLELENRSRIITLPGSEKTIRGFSGAALLLVDEAARVDDGLYYAIRPMLAVSGGALMMLSTPYGKRGVFFEAWTGGEAWERYEVPASECPRISAEFLTEERRALPARVYRQEYECSFEETEDQVFSYQEIENAMTDDISPLFGEAQ
jgi:hypothetical protein